MAALASAVTLHSLLPALNTTLYNISITGANQLGSNVTNIGRSTEVASIHYSMAVTITEAFNGSMDYDEYYLGRIPYPRELKQYPVWEILLKIFIYVLVIVMATTGNCLVITVVFTNSRMRTTTNYYIVNLAASDLLVTLSCSWVHLVSSLNEDWVLGAFFCKFNSFAQVFYLTVVVNYLLIAGTLDLGTPAINRWFYAPQNLLIGSLAAGCSLSSYPGY